MVFCEYVEVSYERDEFGFVLPNLYYQFLTEWKEIDPYEIGDSGICLYAKEDLQERNETYQIEEVEPDYFMIGQEGDLAYFIKKNSDDCIYENDFGSFRFFRNEKSCYYSL